MGNLGAVLFAILAGVSTAIEAFVNGELGKNTTALIATFISLVVGALFFLISILLAGDFKDLANINSINPKLLIGGILGGLIIYFTVKSVPSLGVSNTLTLIVVSQMLIGFFIDSTLLKESIHLYKYIGAILLVIGTFFILS
ncbi:DMT family transporter [Romboutsia sp. 1001216sp1]|uniref:DMT family transporter n=1 Tax=Romboutsia TaxID=1501226 RepID=UPI000B821923|nr:MULTISPECIES: DMT family transporter [Romboutsia]MDB8789926.1 DMT family transporter [Romboutsia sp. 1001216sp1]MDB8793660.1 DMT family transporter [Romboutsia sp. 1001216sp1]MDB8795057.1 DMT family transporter [Romboutsia sp. 1001216sp1]MDB8798867.1 DMT family transporter [Romboutsia sp. 1001216sp1]MDB8801670.1 DMT family transporter [Romboutsia sp. 1001216sp1]